MKNQNLYKRTRYLKELANSMGFEQVGISKAEMMDEEARKLDAWLNASAHGKMGYMANHFDKRVDPRKLVPGAKSVVSLMYNYFTPVKQSDESPKVSRYAYGEDYHKVIKDKLFVLYNHLDEIYGGISGRVFTDSAPVLERDWAKRSGIGWVGRNTMLISPKLGSYYFLAEMILEVEYIYDAPLKDFCGTCRRCIDACPTDAISDTGYVMDGSKCISYLTIELHENIPEDYHKKMSGWAFGCDICQEVCPWNRFSKKNKEDRFAPKEEFINMGKSSWEEMDLPTYKRVFNGTPLERVGFKKLKNNASITFLNK